MSEKISANSELSPEDDKDLREQLFASCIILGEHVGKSIPGVSMDDPLSEFYERPYGFYSEELRSKIINSSVRMAGVGGGGATLAVMLAKEGVCDFSIADPEKVENSNVGRIPVFAPGDVGKTKVGVVGELIAKHNPSATIRVYDRGINRDNIEEFIGYDAGNEGMTVGFDELELKEPELGLMFHRTSRLFGRYAIAATDVGRGGMVTTFDPSSRHTFEHYMGALPKDSEEAYLRKVRGFQLPTIPNIPLNGSINTLRSTLDESISLPTTLRSVLNASDLAMDEFEKVLTLGDKRYGKPHFYPYIHCVDPSRGEDFVTRWPRTKSVSRIVALVLRDAIGLNPPASYSKDDIARRKEYRESNRG